MKRPPKQSGCPSARSLGLPVVTGIACWGLTCSASWTEPVCELRWNAWLLHNTGDASRPLREPRRFKDIREDVKQDDEQLVLAIYDESNEPRDCFGVVLTIGTSAVVGLLLLGMQVS
jgi:hypothetical protein